MEGRRRAEEYRVLVLFEGNRHGNDLLADSYRKLLAVTSELPRSVQTSGKPEKHLVQEVER